MKNLLYALLLISGIACSQIQIIHFNAGWNSANDVTWFEELTDGKLKWMLRANPNFDVKTFKTSFNKVFNEYITSVNYISSDIDNDDLEAISNLLGDS